MNVEENLIFFHLSVNKRKNLVHVHIYHFYSFRGGNLCGITRVDEKRGEGIDSTPSFFAVFERKGHEGEGEGENGKVGQFMDGDAGTVCEL